MEVLTTNLSLVSLNGTNYYINMSDAWIDRSWQDDGIGPYEYWGATGYDSRPYIEISDITFDEVTDEDNNIFTDPQLLADIKAKLFEEDLKEWYSYLEEQSYCYDPED